MITVDCLADCHGHYPKLEGGDLLIVAGDLTGRDTEEEHGKFFDWLYQQNYTGIVFISGNHDGVLEKDQYFFNRSNPNRITEITRNAHVKVQYLCDSGTEFEYVDKVNCTPSLHTSAPFITGNNVPSFNHVVKKLKIWGSPWTKRFEGMNPHCMAFTVDTEEELADKWALIPDDVDILVTHSPPKFGLDKTVSQEYAGSESLRDWIFMHQPKLHVFGHIHEGYGIIIYQKIQKLNIQLYGKVDERLCKTTIINASHVNERYEPVNAPIRIEL